MFSGSLRRLRGRYFCQLRAKAVSILMHSPATAQGTVRPKMPKKLHSSTQFKENIGSPFCTIKSAPKTNAAKQISIPTYQKENSERLPKAVFRNKPSSVDKRQYEVTSTDVNIVDLPYNLTG